MGPALAGGDTQAGGRAPRHAPLSPCPQLRSEPVAVGSPLVLAFLPEEKSVPSPRFPAYHEPALPAEAVPPLQLSPRCGCPPTATVPPLWLSPCCSCPPAVAVPQLRLSPRIVSRIAAPAAPVLTPELAGGEVSGSQSSARLCPPTCMQRVCQGMKATV